MRKILLPTVLVQTSVAVACLHYLLVCSTAVLFVVSQEEVEFPVLVTSSSIADYFEREDLDGLHWQLSNVFAASRRSNEDREVKHELPPEIVSRGGASHCTSASKLQLDLEHAEYLATHLADEDHQHQPKQLVIFFSHLVAPIYRQVLANIPPVDQLALTNGIYTFSEMDEFAGIEAVYNKALYNPPFDEIKDPKTGELVPLLNPQLDLDEIQQQWMGADLHYTNPGIVVVDDILNPAALKRIRQLLLDSTVWYQTKTPLHQGGCVAGAHLDDGLHDRILLQLSLELHKALPRIMQGHPLQKLYADKYDYEYSGVHVHAEADAAVKVHLWLTPNDANLDPTSGGLVVYTARPIVSDIHDYSNSTERIVEKFLKPTNFANVTIPYQQNRAVIFDAALFHQTDKFQFKMGYENRRISLTLLYGNQKRDSSSTHTTQAAQSVKTEL
jgi:hypothetical protein